jgi:hypothetical protein
VKSAPHRHPCSATTPVETVNGYPSTLRIFKIGCSPYWYARVFVHGKYRKASLKTIDKTEAVHRAKMFFMEQFGIQATVKQQLTGQRFATIAEAMMAADARKVRRGERSESLATSNRYVYDRHVKPALGHMDVKTINYAVLERFLNDLEDRELSVSSIRNFLSFTGKVLKYAHRLDIIDRLPQMPMIKSRDGIRGWFSEAEYQRLLAGIDAAISSGMSVRHVAVQPDLRFLAELMVATMLRPSDVKLLQHRHIEIVQGKRLYLRITTSFSKTINSPVVSTAEGVAVYQRLLAYQADLGFGDPDDYLFYPQYTNRKHASDILRRQFAAVLDGLAMRQSPQGEPRTLYSLRHSSIMFAILRGDTNLLKIARNARTSPDMIDRFYARHLTAEMGD